MSEHEEAAQNDDPFHSDTHSRVQHWLVRLRNGDASARDKLIEIVYERMRHLTSVMLRKFPNVRNLTQSTSVNNGAAVRLWQTLERIAPESPRRFFGLAALQIRRQLLDTARAVKRRGQYDQVSLDASGPAAAALEPMEIENDPANLEKWVDFHKAIRRLPKPVREVFHHKYYFDLTQEEIAAIVGVSVKTVRKLYREAQLTLHEQLDGNLPSY